MAGRGFRDSHARALCAVLGLGDFPSQPVEVAPSNLAAFGLVIDDENDAAAVDMLPDRRCQAGAVDGFGQKLGGAERDGDAAILEHGNDDDRGLGEL